jgi:hypothetical protein
LLDRGLEPVVITGEQIPAFGGLLLERLFVYAYREGVWKQMPFQVDEVAQEGMYVPIEDNVLDNNDEIVFLARDVGTRYPGPALITGSLNIGAGWYELEVTNPLSPAWRGWAYLVNSNALTRSNATDYVDFNLGFHRILASDYALGLGVTHIGVDFLKLGQSGVEILDRTKLRLDCLIPGICPITDALIPPVPDDLIKDGPVRVIARGGQMLAYGAMLEWTSVFSFPIASPSYLRLSTDFNQAASGSTFYNAVVTPGITVDGVPERLPATPRSPWWQLSTVSGTLIHVGKIEATGGTLSNYYLDNGDHDPADSGDYRHYGDTGVTIRRPAFPVTYQVTVFFLSGALPNIGRYFVDFAEHPLQVTAHLYGKPRAERLFLPLLLKPARSTTPAPMRSRMQGKVKWTAYSPRIARYG